MEKRNEGNKKKKTFLENKIGAVISSACDIAGSRASNMAFGNERERPISTSAALNKTHPCDQVQPLTADPNCHQVARRRGSISSGILASIVLRKWKSSLKKVASVKLRLKTMVNEGKAEAKTELELCKKRILMGEKCRALNPTGVLHYDKHGILLPED